MLTLTITRCNTKEKKRNEKKKKRKKWIREKIQTGDVMCAK